MLRFAIERGVILSVVITVLCLFGLIALFRVPVQMTPDLDRPTISVRTSWPGATPQDVEAEILIEQEDYLRNLQGLVKMTGSASTGSAEIDLEFSLKTNIQDALIRTNNALSQVPNYPENVDQPRLFTSSTTRSPFIFYAVRSIDPERELPSKADLTQLLEKHVFNRLERVPGVSDASFFGSANHQVQIYVDPDKLAARGITISELRNAVRSRNQDFSGGDVDSGKRRYLIRTVGRYENLEQVENTIIAKRQGNLIRIRDVGEVVLSHEEVRTRSYYNGKPGYTFAIRRNVGANVIEILDGVNEQIARLNDGFLKAKGINIIHTADDVEYVKESIKVVQKNLALGGLLACIILYLFLHALAPTLLGALGVPICCIGAFLGLLVMGRTLNVISLAGVAFAIGMTLDNSIVVLENIFRHRSLGKSHYQAALDGVKEVWTAVLASTLTTVFVFAPILLIQEAAGQLYSDIAIAISASILMSMLVAVTAIPSVASRLSDDADPDAHRNHPILKPVIALSGRFKIGILNMVSNLLESTTRRLMLVSGVLAVSLIVVMVLLPKAEYLPEGEESKIFARMIPPPGYNIEEMDRSSQKVDELLAPYLNLEDDSFERGESKVPPIKYFMRFTRNSSATIIAAPISDDGEHVEALRRVMAETMGQIPGMIGFANRGSIFSGNSGGSRNVQLDINGSDLNSIYQAAKLAFDKTREVMPTAQIRPVPGLTLSQPFLEIRPDWQRAGELGLNTRDLGYMVWALSDGAYLDEYFLDDKKIDIYLYSSKGNVEQPEDLGHLPIYTPQGNTVPLNAVADIRQTVSADSIRRVDTWRTITLNIVPPRDIPLETAVEIVELQVIESLRQSGFIDPGVNMLITGASDDLKAVQEALSGNLFIAVVLSYLLMVAIFSHWGYPLIILLTIPLGISGGVVGLWLMNNVFGLSAPLDMITMLGMVVLIGTVVNNPILLVEQTRKFLAQGYSAKAAVKESMRIRLRPIMMSMLTTVFGLSPIVFLAGAGAELYRGLGSIVLFGLFFSTILTLTFVPALLSLLLEFFERRKKQVT